MLFTFGFVKISSDCARRLTTLLWINKHEKEKTFSKQIVLNYHNIHRFDTFAWMAVCGDCEECAQATMTVCDLRRVIREAHFMHCALSWSLLGHWTHKHTHRQHAVICCYDTMLACGIFLPVHTSCMCLCVFEKQNKSKTSNKNKGNKSIMNYICI